MRRLSHSLVSVVQCHGNSIREFPSLLLQLTIHTQRECGGTCEDLSR